MNKIFKRFLASVLLASLPLAFSACGGGGGGGGNVEMTTLSGVAIKGPIQGALVQVFKLNGDGSSGEFLGSAISGATGMYSIQIPKANAVPPLLMTVSGQTGARYSSESKGGDVDFTASESFRAALGTFDTGKSYTVSPLTEAAYQQLQKFLTGSPTVTADTRIVSAANARIASLFNVSDILADPATDPSYSAALKIVDQMIESSKVIGATNTLQTMNLINQAFVDVTGQAYQTYRTALVTAANIVVAREPALSTVIFASLATAANPPAEPVFTNTTPPSAVTGLKAVAGAETATTSSVTLSWNPALTTGLNRVTGYDVYRNGIKIASVTAAVYVDRPLTPSTTYRYYVIALDAAGNRSVASAEITAATPAAPNLNLNVNGQISTGTLALP